MDDRLPVRDELFLLSHDESGKPLIHVPSLSAGLAGALLIDLALRGLIDGTHGRIGAWQRDQTGDRAPGIIGEGMEGQALAEIRSVGSSRTAYDWIMTWHPGFYDRVCAEMVTVGVLMAKTSRKFGLVPVTRHVPTQDVFVTRARGALRRTVTGVVQPDAGYAALCGLLFVLQLEGSLHLSTGSAELRKQLFAIADRHTPTIREVLSAVDKAVGELATAAF